TTDPTYANRFEKVWRWADWPDAPARNDDGIDLVARTFAGGYCAIQCKFYEPHHVLQKSDIDSFFTASGKAPFTERLIISTSDRWGPTPRRRWGGSRSRWPVWGWARSPTVPCPGSGCGRRSTWISGSSARLLMSCDPTRSRP